MVWLMSRILASTSANSPETPAMMPFLSFPITVMIARMVRFPFSFACIFNLSYLILRKKTRKKAYPFRYALHDLGILFYTL
jgi:hypothetical protein